MLILLNAGQATSPSVCEWLNSFISSETFRNLIAAVTLIIAVIAGFRAMAQWKESKRIKRAEYIKELTDRIRSDDNIVKALNLIEYDRFRYSEDFHESGELERKVDKTLSFFSYICYLKKQRLLSPDEFRFFDYEVTRIFQNRDIVNYLYNLYHFSKKQKRPVSFCYLVEYGLENSLLNHFQVGLLIHEADLKRSVRGLSLQDLTNTLYSLAFVENNLGDGAFLESIPIWAMEHQFCGSR